MESDPLLRNLCYVRVMVFILPKKQAQLILEKPP